MEDLILQSVRELRRNHPGVGCAKLYFLLCQRFGRELMPGRDAFYTILRSHGLMLKRRRTHRTTFSNHPLRKFSNIAKGFVPTSPNELWVSDITYIQTKENVFYLSLVTDAYSRKILGWKLSDSLASCHTLEALNMALESVDPQINLSCLIHHSDRGTQYCSYAYVNRLQEKEIRISMTQSSDPLDNAIAERVNGILKQEWLYRMELKGKDQAVAELERIIRYYNQERPHLSLQRLTPEAAHSKQGKLKKCWKLPETKEKSSLYLESP